MNRRREILSDSVRNNPNVSRLVCRFIIAPLKMAYFLTQASAPAYDFIHLTPKAGDPAKLKYNPIIPVLLPDVRCPKPFR